MTITYDNSEHLRQWVDSLYTTTLPQGQGRLVTVNEDTGDIIGYCCLGQGSVECLGVTVEVSELNPADFDDEEHVSYGEEGYVAGAYTTLAPPEFVAWLGLPEPDSESDVHLDIPAWLATQGEPLRQVNGHVIPGKGPESMRTAITCASMNDAGFTFAQIADTLRYFGVAD